MADDLVVLNQKMDTLMGYMEQQQRRQQAMEELQADMVPIVNHFIKLTIDELAEIGQEFQLEDLLFLLKRVLRNTPLLIKLVDQLEGIMGLTDEVDLLGKQVFNTVVEQLDAFERKGYFALAGEGLKVADKLVAEIQPEDLESFGDTAVNAAAALKTPAPEKAPSTLQLLRELNDPQVRIGMAKMLNMLKALA